MAEPAFDCPDLDAFHPHDQLGLSVTGQHVGTDHTVLSCPVVEPEEVSERSCWCTNCGELGVPRDTVVRRRVAGSHGERGLQVAGPLGPRPRVGGRAGATGGG